MSIVDGSAKITTCVCLCHYLERHLRFGSSAGKSTAAINILVNRADLEAARAENDENCGQDMGASAPFLSLSVALVWFAVLL